MNRVDIIGAPGSGKSTFLGKYDFSKIQDESYLKIKATANGLTKQLLLKALPNKLSKSYAKSLSRDFFNAYEIQDVLEERNKGLFQLVLMDQVFVEDSFYEQAIRLNCLINRLTEVEILEDYFHNHKDKKITLFDESLIHSLILVYMNLKVDHDHFFHVLSQLTPPKGLLIFKNDLGIASQRIINERLSKKSKRATDNKEYQKLLQESENYQTLVDLCIHYFEGKIPVQILDLEENDTENKNRLNDFVRNFSVG